MYRHSVERNSGAHLTPPHPLFGASEAGTGTWDSIIVSKPPFNIVPLEYGASAGTWLGQSQIEVAGVKEGLG